MTTRHKVVKKVVKEDFKPGGEPTVAASSFDLGVDLFNRSHFFDAHEALEDVWRTLPRDEVAGGRRRLHMQGMVQLAVAFHHESAGNYVGARSVLERAVRNLDGADDSFPDLDFERLQAELTNWRKHFAGATPRPKLPRIVNRKAVKQRLVYRKTVNRKLAP
ncbi:MAG: DUF309 domain-containing protein [Terriglobales bacterium]